MATDITHETETSKFAIEVLSVPVSKFRANLSQMLDELGEVYKEITLTRNGKIIAHILPPKYLVPSMEGCLEGIIVIPDGFDDSVSAIDEDWEEQMDASWERSENYRKYMTTSGDLRT